MERNRWQPLNRRLNNELGQHVFGERLGEITHMCPECGRSNPLCPVCLGNPNGISTQRLDQWQRETLAAAGEL